jgi:hypothetical protein
MAFSDLDVLRELEEGAVVSVPWHAAPCAVDEDGDEWWKRERERAAPRAGGSLLGGGVGSRAPLAVVVEEGPP